MDRGMNGSRNSQKVVEKEEESYLQPGCVTSRP